MNLHQVTCPSCGAVGWVNDGDSDDVTTPSAEAAICWNCYHTFFIETDKTYIECMFGEDAQPCDVMQEFAHKTASQAASPCWIDAFSSRACDRGTRGCTRIHEESTND